MTITESHIRTAQTIRVPNRDVSSDDDTYGVDLIGAIHTLLQGYSGGISIIRELAQNADDAPGADERWLEFHFRPDQLVVRNSSQFREKDFQRIKRVASGGKIFDEHKTTGAFGVGFVSVYQLTDTPILRSSGREIIFLPEQGKAPPKPCPVTHYTEFELPYRCERTPVGDRLGMDVITEAWVRNLIDTEIPREVPALLFFQRKLQRIAVYENNHLVLEVRRTIVPATSAHEPDRITITITHMTTQTEQHWLRFSGQVPGPVPHRADKNHTPEKDTLVQIVVPDSDVPSDAWQQAGRLYNYLPTDMHTGLPFHINGDFYPSTDRKSIDIGHDWHRTWNKQVLQALGDCFADALPYLLEHFQDEPLQLYQRLPIKPADELVKEPIQRRFFEAARPLAIYYTHAGWRTAKDARWVRSELRPIVTDNTHQLIDPRLMEVDIERAAQVLIDELSVQEYTLGDLLERIQRDVQSGCSLKHGPDYLCTVEQLNRLYSVFEQPTAQDYVQQIRQTPIFIDHNTTLWRADQCVKTRGVQVQQNLAESGLHFWSGNSDTYRDTAALVPEFTLSHLWRVLRKQLPAGSVPLPDAPRWMNNTNKLYRLYRTILDISNKITAADVDNLPLCLDRENRLRPPNEMFLPPEGEPIIYDILKEDPVAPLVSQAIYEDKDFRPLYEQMGVKQFGLEKMLERLRAIANAETPIDNASACLNSRDKLLRLYRYLNKQRHAFEKSHIDVLRYHLPIWMCRDHKLHIARELTLLSETAGEVPDCITFDLVLDVESRENLHPLFRTLGLKPLDPESFIQQYLLPQYPGLSTDKAKHTALKYVRDHVALLNDPAHSELYKVICQAPLIRGNDNTYHCARALCFPDNELQSLFPNHICVPHHTYFGNNFSPEQVCQSVWYELFQRLGMNYYASPQLVVNEITTFTQQYTPSDGRDHIEKLFRYLEERWEKHYAQKHNGEIGSRLREMAWLPADGDGEQWYSPTRLYPRTEKQVVDKVAKVLGFTSSRITRQSFSQALGFPSAQSNTSIVVDQLLALTEQNQPADSEQGNDAIYKFLDRYSIKPEDLQRLRGKPIIYIGQRYWKPSQIFLADYDHHFGAYRGYWRRDDYRKLMRAFGARDEPEARDYCGLIHEISTQEGETISDQDVSLMLTAYDKLANAPDDVLTTLKTIPCVVSRTSAEPYTLRFATSVILSPAEHYQKALPDVPIAVCHPDGQKTLRRLGVRAIENVLTVEFQLAKNRSQASSGDDHYVHLDPIIDRLLFHYDRKDRLQDIWDELRQIRMYEQDAVQVVYYINLGRQRYRSEALIKDVHYERDEHCVYLQKGLSRQERAWALAEVLHQVLGIGEIAKSVLKDVIVANPGDAYHILDRNDIKTPPLPPTPPEDVSIEITQSGRVNQPYTFRAQVIPPTVSPAPTYAWSVDGKAITGADKAVYTHTWQDAGEKTLTVTVTNDLGQVTQRMQVSVSDFRPVAPKGVTIRTNSSVTVGTELLMTAEVEPDNAAQPLTYTWKIDGQQVVQTSTNSYSHRWKQAGQSEVTVEVQNSAGKVQAQCHIMVTKPPSAVSIKEPGQIIPGQEKTVEVAAPQPVAPERVTIQKQTDCTVGRSCTFTAKVSPQTAEAPLAFEWRIDGKDIGEDKPTIRHTWDTEGSKQITVMVLHQSGEVRDQCTVTVKPQPPRTDKPRSPTGATDQDDLRERARADAEARGISLDLPPDEHPVTNGAKRRGLNGQQPENTEVRVARFVLSYPEVHRGFLRLNKTNKGMQLFADHPDQVEGITDYGDTFTLWFKWERDYPIAYNEKLAVFFAEQNIQAGCIVYIERLSKAQYRLYYNKVQQRVPQVKMAFNEQGELHYETHDVEIACEVDEAVYCADMRFADETALALEAIGKKTVKEMICDIFLKTNEEWLPETDIKRLVHASRMLAASTVTQTLHKEPYFESDGNGRWRFDHAIFLSNTPNNAIWKWQRATDTLIECDDEVLLPALSPVQHDLDRLRERLVSLTVTAEDTVSATSGIVEIIAQLNNTPYKSVLAQRLGNMLHQHIADTKVDVRTDPILHSVMQTAHETVWDSVLRAALEGEIQVLRENQAYDRAIALLHHWADVNDKGNVLLREVEAETKAWNMVQAPDATLEDMCQAIKQAPKLIAAREKLFQAVQNRLYAYPADHWLKQEQPQIVPMFLQHITGFHQAREYLSVEQGETLDHNIWDEARKLWDDIRKEDRIMLLISLQKHAPTISPPVFHIQYLLHCIGEYRSRRMLALLLAEAAWLLCPSEYTAERRKIASHLADIYNQLEIWELSQSMPWIQHLDRRKADDLKSGISMFRNGRYKRLQSFIQRFDQIEVTPLSQALHTQQDDLRERTGALISG